ncbi:MAG: hypothetical protein J7L10_05500, partial [Methanomicrobia archaeon]|nr:hypothetical protein [Methanomicrobia archaeon]
FFMIAVIIMAHKLCNNVTYIKLLVMKITIVVEQKKSFIHSYLLNFIEVPPLILRILSLHYMVLYL